MKLASIETIQEIKPHPNADRLDLAIVLGYQCVVAKGQFKAGQNIVFIQPDTCLPPDDTIEYVWCLPYKKYVGARVKAVEFRKEWSEGIVVSLEELSAHLRGSEVVGEEVSQKIGVTKFKAPEPKEEGAIGSILPLFMKETNEERFENLQPTELPYGRLADLSLKIDGKSCTYFYHLPTDRFGVCGRSLEFDPNYHNIYTRHIDRLRDKIVSFCREKGLSLAFRGEVYGQGSSYGANNPHNNVEPGFACFSILNLDARRYERKGSPLYYLDVCRHLNIETVPVVDLNVRITPELLELYSKGLTRLSAGEHKNIKFEGVVVNYDEGSFKIINKHYDSNK